MFELGDVLDEVGGRAPPHLRGQIDDLVDEYMDILDVHDRPRVVIRDNLGSRWLGRDKWTERDPNTSTIELQRRILDDPRTLERVVAHEMVHHANAMGFTDEQIARMRIGISPMGHGRDFLELADRINAIKGDGFVTVVSDADYVYAETSRPYLLLIVELSDGRLGYAWGSRITPRIERFVRRRQAEGGVLLRTTDPRWSARGAKMSSGRVSIPDDEGQHMLRRLLEENA